MESPEAAHGRSFTDIVETGAAEARGAGRAAQGIASRMRVIELEGRRGKLRIQLKDASASYLATLSRELWESAS